MRFILKATLAGISVIAIFTGFAFYSYSQFEETQTIGCAANPGWTVCEDASHNSESAAVFAIFLLLSLGLFLKAPTLLERPTETLEFGVVDNA